MVDGSKKGDVIIIHCPYCERKLAAPRALAGKYAKCPSCPNRVRVPEFRTGAESDSRIGDSRIGDAGESYQRRRFCPDCGNRLLPKEGVCSNCARARSTSRPIKCPACERSLDVGTVICPRCHHDRGTAAPSIRGSVRAKPLESLEVANWTVTCRTCRTVSYFEMRREPPALCPNCAGKDVEAISQTPGQASPQSQQVPDQEVDSSPAKLRCFDCSDFVQTVARAEQRGLPCPQCGSLLTESVGESSVERLLACQNLADRAMKLLEEQQFGQAAGVFIKAGKLHEDHPHVQRGLAQSLCATAVESGHKEKFAEGLRLLERTLLLFPKHKPALHDLQTARVRYLETFGEEYRVTDHTYTLHCQSLNNATTNTLKKTLGSNVEQILRQLSQSTGALNDREAAVVIRELRDIQQSLKKQPYRLDIVSHLPLRWLDDRLKQLTASTLTMLPVLDAGQIRFTNQAWFRTLAGGEKTLQELMPLAADPLQAYPFVLAARARKLSLSNGDLIDASQKRPQSLFEDETSEAEVSLEIAKQHQQQFVCQLSFRCHAGPEATRIAIAKPPGLGTEDVFLAVQVQRIALVLLWVLYGGRSMETMRKSQLDYLALHRQLQGRWLASHIGQPFDFRDLDARFARLGVRRRETPKGWHAWQFAGLRGWRRLGRRLVVGIERLTGALDTDLIGQLHGLSECRQWPAQQAWPHLIIGQADGAGLGKLCEFLSSKVASPPLWKEGDKSSTGSPLLTLPDGPPPVMILNAGAVSESFDPNLVRNLGLDHFEIVDDVIIAAGRVLPLIDPEWTRIWLGMKHVLANS